MTQCSDASAEVTKIVADGLDVVMLSRPCCKKFYITVHPGKQQDDPYSMFEILASFLREHDARIVMQHVFGSCELHTDGIGALERCCGRIAWPVTWIEADGPSGKFLTGTQVYAISGADVEPIQLDGRIVGGMFEDEDARYCLLGDIRPTDTGLTRTLQARQAFEKMESALDLAQMDFSNVIRTWIYIDDLLSWYDKLNDVRTQFFTERGVFQGLVPASTGIGVGNHAGAALVTDVFAMKPRSNNVRIEAVGSPLQCPATNYKSSFSRAVEIALPDHRRLYVSGTASIEPGGKTAHVGDVEKQIALTMKVVQAILESRKMSWADVSRAIAYFKDIEETPMFEKYCRDNQLPFLPIAIAHSDICRDDLLFEIEVDAVVT